MIINGITRHLALFAFIAYAHSLGCKNENGSSVDWWVILKAPKIATYGDDSLSAGYAYKYGDASTNSMERSNHSLLENTTGALAITLSQIFTGNTTTTGWLMYNDQLPTGDPPEDYGHTKGVLAWDSEGGFWLVHSVPNFPVVSEPYSYPRNETKNGQSFLCVSHSISNINVIGEMLLINKPYVFSSNFPSSFASSLSSIEDVLARLWFTSPIAIKQIMESEGNNSFIVFAKNSEWDQDLYEGIVEPVLNTGLLVQTWREGETSRLMPTFCTPEYYYDSINVLQMYIRSGTTPIFWDYTKDHSKWAVSMYGNPYVCIGDINRMFSQFKRGGGMVCFENESMWMSFNSTITLSDVC